MTIAEKQDLQSIFDKNFRKIKEFAFNAKFENDPEKIMHENQIVIALKNY